jgi:hypothetical protein
VSGVAATGRVLSWGALAGGGVGLLGVIAIGAALLSGDGATGEALLPALLLVLPVLGAGALAGYLGALAVVGVRRLMRAR